MKKIERINIGMELSPPSQIPGHLPLSYNKSFDQVDAIWLTYNAIRL